MLVRPSNESVESFINRCEEASGLSIRDIPRVKGWTTRLVGPIVCSSPHGQLVFVDHDYQDEEGYDYYSRCVLVERGGKFPPANRGATGQFKQSRK